MAGGIPSDLEIAQAAELRPIADIAGDLGIAGDELELYGRFKAKVRLELLERLSDRPGAKYIDVSAITPTPLGEGKTVNTIGLGLGLNRIGKKAIVCLRQPSMGPTFGIKGGAAGGGYSQVLPMEDFNLHLTGDIHAVGAAHNLLAAMLDNHIHQGNALGIEPRRVFWRRVVDMSDRALRNIVIGLGGKANGVPRESGFDITVSSEIMAILALTAGLRDLRERLGRIVVAENGHGAPITADDLRAAGAMTALLREALMPTLMQTTEHTPVFVHAGPFANIAHGNSSILADQLAMKLGDYVVTESGFGVDMGCEKFMDIKCRYSGLKPDAVMLVVTVRALKMHGGDYVIKPGKPLDPRLLEEDVEAVRRGADNMTKHIENIARFGVPAVVAINRFPQDTEAEHEAIRHGAMKAGAFGVAVSEAHGRGGEGAEEVARLVAEAAETASDFRFLYPLELPIKEKIRTIALDMYGADGVDYDRGAERQIAWLEDQGFGRLPVCMAKTHLSLSHDATLKNRPAGFRLPVREVKASAGAGFLVVYCGDVMMMPGLPSAPGAARIDIDAGGRTTGLF